jgi:hypothetical protein
MRKLFILLVLGILVGLAGWVEGKEIFVFNLSKAQQDIEHREVKTAFGTLTIYHHSKPYGLGNNRGENDYLKLNGRIIYTDQNNEHIYLQNKVFHLSNAEVIPLYEHTGGNFGDAFKLIQINQGGSVSLSNQSLYITRSTMLEQQGNRLILKRVYRDSPNKLENWVFENGVMRRLQ